MRTPKYVLRSANLLNHFIFLTEESWELIHSCKFCTENNGNWDYQTSLDYCKSRCKSEGTRFMTYDVVDKSLNCRCDRSCDSTTPSNDCAHSVFRNIRHIGITP